MIDTHLHSWSRAHSRYAWLDDAPALEPEYLPDVAIAASKRAGFESHVLVQAEDSVADTEWMIDAARAAPSVVGVVAWAPLDDAERATDMIESWDPIIVGARALVHTYPDPAVLASQTAIDVAKALAARGLALDIPDGFPRLLGHAATLAAASDVTVVIDHLGKPPRELDDQRRWRDELAGVAAIPSTVAKVSGLHHAGDLLQGTALERAWDTALDLFGPSRLMVGTDWPMPLLGDGAEAAAAQLRGLLEQLSEAEQHSIGVETAIGVYGRDEHAARH